MFQHIPAWLCGLKDLIKWGSPKPITTEEQRDLPKNLHLGPEIPKNFYFGPGGDEAERLDEITFD